MLNSLRIIQTIGICFITSILVVGEMFSQDFKTNVFVSGTNGYHTYRIPAMAITTKETILAFCEGRKNERSDAGNIDVLLKSSYDNGNTWSFQQIIWDDSRNTCGNPCPIVDRETGTIHLLMTWNRGDDKEKEIINEVSIDTRKIFVSSSNDDGRTWTHPREITSDVKKTDWTWYATGPGAGIQIERGEHKGRLVAPCDHIEAVTKDYYSHVIYSDDHGQTWILGGSSPSPKVNECQVVEISKNRLMLNMRNYDRSIHSRQTSLSDDGGKTWYDQKFNLKLIEPICQASLRASLWKTDSTRQFLFFSNPSDSLKRINMTIKVSLNEGNSWPISKIIHAGPSAYSDLSIINFSLVACLFEAGEKSPYENIVFTIIPISDLTENEEYNIGTKDD
jgi:sialidase-1